VSQTGTNENNISGFVGNGFRGEIPMRNGQLQPLTQKSFWAENFYISWEISSKLDVVTCRKTDLFFKTCSFTEGKNLRTEILTLLEEGGGLNSWKEIWY
jgi:hypothetical protein